MATKYLKDKYNDEQDGDEAKMAAKSKATTERWANTKLTEAAHDLLYLATASTDDEDDDTGASSSQGSSVTLATETTPTPSDDDETSA